MNPRSLLIVFTLCIMTIECFLEDCEKPLHYGIENCKNASSVRYHFDTEFKKCLAFKYSGCGGNSNNFATYNDCRDFCIPMDFSTCPAASKPVPSVDGSTTCDSESMKSCTGKSAYCSLGAFMGTCCDANIRDKVNMDYDKQCGPNQNKTLIDLGGISIPLFAKNCDSKFCPENTTCTQGNYFAFCCA